MNETIAYYNRNAVNFIAGTLHADMSENRRRFLEHVKPGGRILDAGCGSGRDALAFKEAGYAVDAFDASPEICKRASEILGFPVDCKRFEELEGEEEYNAIWACASLLHVNQENLPDVLNRLKKLLRPDGVLYVSFKEGVSERVKNGRFFHDTTEEECKVLLEDAGLEVLEIWKSQDVREGRGEESWINGVGKKTVQFVRD